MSVQADLARLRRMADEANADLWPNLTPADRSALQGLIAMFDVAVRLLQRFDELAPQTRRFVLEVKKD